MLFHAFAMVRLATLCVVFVGLMSAPSLAESPPASNEQEPVNFTWLALAQSDVPGVGGLRGGVSVYVPGLPIYVAGQLSYSWGLSPSHLDGKRDSWLTRLLTHTMTFEARVGVTFEAWGLDRVSTNYDHGSEYTAQGETFQRSTYEVDMPTFHRYTLYAGYRGRSVPGEKSCSDRGPTPEDCAETASGFVMLGYEHLDARNAVFRTAENGELRHEHLETMAVHLLYSTDDDYTRETFLSRIGAEFVWIVEDTMGYQMSVGWDGNYAMLTLGIGVGGHYGFGGAIPSSADMHREGVHIVSPSAWHSACDFRENAGQLDQPLYFTATRGQRRRARNHLGALF